MNSFFIRNDLCGLVFLRQFIDFSFSKMTCFCQHCIEIKKQIDRAQKRQTVLFKTRKSKMNVK